MRVSAVISVLLSGLLFAGSCMDDGHSEPKGNRYSKSTGSGQSDSRRIGGCSADTIPLDMTFISSCDATSSHVRISILSVEHATVETYKEAAAGLASLLDSLGVGICGVPQLVFIREGPCWPRHRIDFRLEKESEKIIPGIRSALAGGMLGGLRPSEKRPEGYGIFFVQATVGSTDRWTLWYPAARP